MPLCPGGEGVSPAWALQQPSCLMKQALRMWALQAPYVQKEYARLCHLSLESELSNRS